MLTNDAFRAAVAAAGEPNGCTGSFGTSAYDIAPRINGDDDCMIGPHANDASDPHTSLCHGTDSHLSENRGLCKCGTGPVPPSTSSWFFGQTGDSCDTTCQSQGRSCVDGDWGVHSRSDYAAALTQAGEDPSVKCSQSTPYAPDSSSYQPATCSSSSCSARWRCYYPSSSTQQCSGHSDIFSRLCKCSGG